VEVNLKVDLLLAKDFVGETAWDIAAEKAERFYRNCGVGVEKCK